MKYDPVKIGEIISSNRKLLESPERKGKRMNQEELGYKLGCSRKTIGKWEDGQAIPPLDAMLKMCEMFECELDYLLGVIDCKNRVDYEITGQIPLSEETVKGLRELMYDIQDQQPYSFPDGFGGVDSIDAQLLAGLIDRVVSALLYCHNVWGLDGDALLSKTLNMIIAREYHNETFDENDQLHGDRKSVV